MRQIRAQRDVWDAHTSRDWPGLPPLSKGLYFDVSQVRSLLRIRPVCVHVCVSVLSIYCSVYVSARAAGTFNQPIRLLCVPRLAFPFDVTSRRSPKMKFHIQIFQLFFRYILCKTERERWAERRDERENSLCNLIILLFFSPQSAAYF